MWFGDLVTMRWWDDLWLNESFASWASHLADSSRPPEFTEPVDGFTNSAKTMALPPGPDPPRTRSPRTTLDLEAVEVNFDGITYAKGASALIQLVAWVGSTSFWWVS